MATNINDNAQSAQSQCKMIAEYLQKGLSITPLDALEMFGCCRLASRIHDLRDKGYDIVSNKIKTNSGKWVCEYKLNNK